MSSDESKRKSLHHQCHPTSQADLSPAYFTFSSEEVTSSSTNHPLPKGLTPSPPLHPSDMGWTSHYPLSAPANALPGSGFFSAGHTYPRSPDLGRSEGGRPLKVLTISSPRCSRVGGSRWSLEGVPESAPPPTLLSFEGNTTISPH